MGLEELSSLLVWKIVEKVHDDDDDLGWRNKVISYEVCMSEHQFIVYML